MNEYHKIDSIFKRNMELPNKPFIMGAWSKPEFEYLQNNKWEWTEKVDGTNIRVMFNGKEIIFGGKSEEAQIPASLVKYLQDKFLPQLDLFKETFDGDESTEVCFYGEGFGHKIQGKVGTDYLMDKVSFYLFDIKIGRWWLQRQAVWDLACKFCLVPPTIVGEGTINEAVELVKKGFKSSFGTADAEGLVLRPTTELHNRKGERIITKVKCRDFKEEK